MSAGQMLVAALGRPFSLGILYDAHKDQLIPGVTLWNKETIDKNTEELPQQSSQYQITASDSLESKASLLDIEASLKASFMGGLVEVGGSAKYLNDRKSSNKQSRVTFQYKATTVHKQLMMTHLINTKMEESHAKNGATHVVTNILYGANAFFVFDSEKSDESSHQNIEGSMEAVVRKIPMLDIEASAKVKLTDEEKHLTDKLSCKFYGDFILKNNTMTFEGSVEMYRQLPNMLKGNGVPLKVWLTPLKTLIPTAPQVYDDICISLQGKVENTFEHLREIEVRCNDCLEEKVVQTFPQLFKLKLMRFKSLCAEYTATLQHTMREKFPLIRAGKEDYSSVEKLLDKMEESQCSCKNLNHWLEKEEEKISAVKFCVELKGVEMLPRHSTLDRNQPINLRAENVLCFFFNSPESTDHCLEQMGACLHSQDWPKVSPPTEDHCDDSFNKINEKLRIFRGLVEGLSDSSRFHFLVTVEPNEKYKGATIYHYRDSRLVSKDFSIPPVPDVEKVTDKQDLIWYATHLTLDPDTMNGWLSLSDDNKKATVGSWQEYPELPQRFEKDIYQVLCTRPLNEKHYWEVKLSEGSNRLGVGLMYKKKGGPNNEFGIKESSWYFGITDDNYLTMQVSGHRKTMNMPRGDCNRLAVFLDYPGGTLSFYKVTPYSLAHLYTFRENFDKTRALYTGFYIYNTNNYAALCTDL
ncbi:neoverrucotoxin subunit beta-like [Echeneis naucrates]|uniref:Neoverrucotoxin subunit beta-like n=1 Tax=Echeneis naucrates TaxID=173247 RepID=A0A665VL29_ECHNA|nr:neoverrucotoxin subunit beta-like [Echeneis naucrates]